MDELLLGALGGAGGLVLGVLIGKYSDATNQAILLKNLTRKDYIVLSLVDNETSTEAEYVVERKEDVIEWGEFAWMVKGAKFYKRSKEGKMEGGGARISNRNGVAILYVDKKQFIPVEVGQTQVTKISAKAVSSGLNAWMLNIAKKRLTALFKNLDSKLVIAIVLGAVGIIATYYFNTGTHNICQKAFDLLNRTG